MNFDVLDKTMRIYEQSLDQKILPDLYLAARLDGRNFTRLTKEICAFDASPSTARCGSSPSSPTRWRPCGASAWCTATSSRRT